VRARLLALGATVLGVGGLAIAGGLTATSHAAGSPPVSIKPIPSNAYHAPSAAEAAATPSASQTLPPNLALPASVPAGSCGAWSLPTAPAIVAITNLHGQIKNCLEVGTTWVLLTVGGPAGASHIGVLHRATSDTECTSGTNPLADNGFQWIGDPYPASSPGYAAASLLTQTGSALLIDLNGHQLTFNPTTGTFAEG
jgi:hypothetical protein